MLNEEDLAQLQRVLDDQPCLLGREGFKLALPDPIFHLLLQAVGSMRKGQTVLLISEDEMLTTQAAANYLGVSRPFLIGLLEGGKIPHHKVGSHRRVRLADLRVYARHDGKGDCLGNQRQRNHSAREHVTADIGEPLLAEVLESHEHGDPEKAGLCVRTKDDEASASCTADGEPGSGAHLKNSRGP